MAKLFAKEQARAWLRENSLKDGKSIETAFIAVGHSLSSTITFGLCLLIL